MEVSDRDLLSEFTGQIFFSKTVALELRLANSSAAIEVAVAKDPTRLDKGLHFFQGNPAFQNCHRFDCGWI